MAGVYFNKGGGKGSKGGGVWLIGATRTGGTFLISTLGTQVAGELTSISSIATDATSLALTLIGDRGVDYEPVVRVNGVLATRSPTNTLSTTIDGTFQWTVTVPISDNLKLATSDGATTLIKVTQETPAVTSNLTIIDQLASDPASLYPGIQTEVKQGDTIYATFQTDKPINAVIGVTLSGANCVATGTYLAPDLTYDVPTETYTVRLTIGRTSIIASQVTIQINTRTTQGAISVTPATSNNTILCNNLRPTVTLNSITYPVNQQALKNNETAIVDSTVTNNDTITFLLPSSQLTLVDPADTDSVRTLRRFTGTYNVTAANVTVRGQRQANDSTTDLAVVVYISNVAPTLGITAGPTALISGGNDGTNAQPYVVTVTSSQRLQQAPTLNMSAATPQNAGFSWTPTAVLFTRNLVVHDDDPRGIANFNTLTATSLSGLVTNDFNGNATESYTIAGFVQRNMILPAFANETQINVPVTVEANVRVHWQYTNLNLVRSTTETIPTVNSFFIRNPFTATPTIVLLDKSGTDASSQNSVVEISEII